MAPATLFDLYFIGEASARSRYQSLLTESGGQWFDFSQDPLSKLRKPMALVFDVTLASLPNVQRVQEIVQAVPRDVPRLFVVDKTQRIEVVHAGVIGATMVSNRPLPMRDLRYFLKHKGAPMVAGGEASVHSIESAAGSLESLFLAVTQGEAPDHVKVYAACDEVASAVSQDGLSRWLNTVRTHHQGTMQHCLIVAGVLTKFGQAAGMSDRDVQTLTRIGLLHDVGKAAIPTEVLDKPGKLTDEEFAVIKTHPYQGFKFLSRHGDVTPEVLAAVVGHHEYLDGSGYPYGIAGKAIGDLVRITTICDIYGALVERRAYKAEMSPRDAVGVLEKLAAEGKVEEPLVRVLRKSVLT